MWYDLKENPPVGNRCVVLFPVVSDCGILYITSNSDYARGKYALEAGYTHYMYIDPAPEEDKVNKLIQDYQK